mgnify:CR=1 FL=1
MRAALRDAWPEAAWPEAAQDGQPMDGPSTPPRRVGHYVQLIVHEWVANLVRHATFSDSPCICLRVLLYGETARCVITDNSTGFDLASALSTIKANASPLPETGMGLRIIDACTAGVSYRKESPLHHRFTASVPYDHEPWMNVLS